MNLVKMIPVEMSNKMYDEISKKVRESYVNACILFIDQIDKEWPDHEVMKKSKPVTVLKLFHGTCEKNIDSIISQGFKSDMNVRSAYGTGTYFAKSSSYSSSYMSTSKCDEITYMFLCDVIAEECRCSGDIYVTPNDSACVPRYLIAFYKNAN